MKFVLQFWTALVFLVFDSNNENEETLENQNPAHIATDMYELIKPIQYYACKTTGNVTMVFLVFDSNNWRNPERPKADQNSLGYAWAD